MPVSIPTVCVTGAHARGALHDFIHDTRQAAAPAPNPLTAFWPPVTVLQSLSLGSEYLHGAHTAPDAPPYARHPLGPQASPYLAGLGDPKADGQRLVGARADPFNEVAKVSGQLAPARDRGHDSREGRGWGGAGFQAERKLPFTAYNRDPRPAPWEPTSLGSEPPLER